MTVPASAQASPASGRLPWESVSSQAQTAGARQSLHKARQEHGHTASEQALNSIHK